MPDGFGELLLLLGNADGVKGTRADKEGALRRNLLARATFRDNSAVSLIDDLTGNVCSSGHRTLDSHKYHCHGTDQAEADLYFFLRCFFAFLEALHNISQLNAAYSCIVDAQAGTSFSIRKGAENQEMCELL